MPNAAEYRSMDTVSSTAGLCTLTATMSPLPSRRPCTPARGSPPRPGRAELGVHVLPLAPELRSPGCRTRSCYRTTEPCRTAFCSSVIAVGGEDVGADASAWPELDVRRAEGGDDVPELNRALHRCSRSVFFVTRSIDDAGDEPARDGGELDDALRHAAGRSPPVLRDELRVVVQTAAASSPPSALMLSRSTTCICTPSAAKSLSSMLVPRRPAMRVLRSSSSSICARMSLIWLDIWEAVEVLSVPDTRAYTVPPRRHATSAHSLPRRKSLPEGARGCRRAADGRRRRDREGGGHLLCSRLTPLTPLSTL